MKNLTTKEKMARDMVKNAKSKIRMYKKEIAQWQHMIDTYKPYLKK